MKKQFFIVATFVSVSTTAFAALAPLQQSIKEIKAILEDPQLTTELTSGEAIDAIEKNESGYELWTNRSHLEIVVHYKPQEMPGPIPFDIQIHKAESKEDLDTDSDSDEE